MCHILPHLYNTLKTADEISAQLRKGLLEYTIILSLGRSTMTVTELMEHLDSAGISLSPGTLYPLISRMASNSILAEQWEPSSTGPDRKFLALTEDGLKLAKVYKNSWDELVTTVAALRA